MNLKVEYCAAQIIENAPFKIDRPEGSYRYIFFHFTSQVTLVINNQEIIAHPGTCSSQDSNPRPSDSKVQPLSVYFEGINSPHPLKTAKFRNQNIPLVP